MIQSSKNKSYLSVITLNCKGINNTIKYQKIMNIFKAYHADIICFQETNLKPTHNNFIINNWHLFKSYNYYIAILINNSNIKIKNSFTLKKGYVLTIDFELNNLEFRLYNIYSSPDRQSRINFQNNFLFHQKLNITNIILDDLNTILYLDRDRISLSKYQKDPSANLILEKLKNFTDTYSIFNSILQFIFEMHSY